MVNILASSLKNGYILYFLKYWLVRKTYSKKRVNSYESLLGLFKNEKLLFTVLVLSFAYGIRISHSQLLMSMQTIQA